MKASSGAMALSGHLMLLAVLLAGCFKSTHEYRYPSPVEPVELSVEAEGKRRPTAERTNEVYLMGASPPSADAAVRSPDRVLIGRFKGVWAPPAIAWVDATTVNVCPLNGDRTALTTASVLVTETTKRPFHITTDCEAFRRAQQRPAG